MRSVIFDLESSRQSSRKSANSTRISSLLFDLISDKILCRCTLVSSNSVVRVSIRVSSIDTACNIDGVVDVSVV